MNIEEYKAIIEETTVKEYPTYYQDKILKLLKEKKLIYNDKRYKNEKNLLDVTRYDKSNDKLKFIIENLEVAIKEIEIFEFKRAYRYCSIFSITNYTDDLLDKFNGEQINKFSEDINVFDDLSFTAVNPTCKIESDKTIFKFSFLLSNKDDTSKRIKYPILAIIHKDINTLEIRLDTVQFAYRDKELFYNDRINSILAWFKSVLNMGITTEEQKVIIDNINFEAIVKYMRAEKNDDVTIVALKMRREGMMAYLDAASNEELTIPILGELKKLISENERIFEKNKDTKDIKSIITRFINEIEETSSLPSVKALWGEKKIKVLLTHGYQNEEYTIFKYSDELGDEEMMDYVTKYLVQCKKELDEKFNN